MRILLTEQELHQGVRRLADEIRQDYGGRPLTIVGVLIGSVVLLAELIRLLDIPLRVELVQARGYRHGSPRPGPLVIDLGLLSSDVRGRDVLLIDDIFDTGRTLSHAANLVLDRWSGWADGPRDRRTPCP